MTYSPWRTVAAMPDVTVAFADMGSLDGRTYRRLRTILLNRHLSQVERRCTLAHELEHIHGDEGSCGDYADSGRLTQRQERRCHAAAARKLIPLALLIEKARWTGDHDELAEELHVDRDTLQARLDHLHPSERAAITRALGTA